MTRKPEFLLKIPHSARIGRSTRYCFDTVCHTDRQIASHADER